MHISCFLLFMTWLQLSIGQHPQIPPLQGDGINKHIGWGVRLDLQQWGHECKVRDFSIYIGHFSVFMSDWWVKIEVNCPSTTSLISVSLTYTSGAWFVHPGRLSRSFIVTLCDLANKACLSDSDTTIINFMMLSGMPGSYCTRLLSSQLASRLRQRRTWIVWCGTSEYRRQNVLFKGFDVQFDCGELV